MGNKTSAMNNDIRNNITGIVYKEYNEPKISFFKRDKEFLFGDGIIQNVNAATTANINVSSAGIFMTRQKETLITV